jgi:hypothetical protein
VNATPIASLVPRQRALVKGRVVSVSTHQWPALSFMVQLADRTGTMTLSFLGCHGLPGFECGRWLSPEGTPAQLPGRLVMLNPLYMFEPSPGC